jgi:hypothetical protein
MYTFADRVTRVAVESAALARYLHALPPAAWEHPSACTRWVIGDVIAHLVDSGAFYTESITRGLQGERTPFANRPPAGSVNGAAVATLTATRVLAARQRLGAHLLTAFDDTVDRFHHLVTRLTPAEARPLATIPAISSPCGPLSGYGCSKSSSTGGTCAPHWSPWLRWPRRVRPCWWSGGPHLSRGACSLRGHARRGGGFGSCSQTTGSPRMTCSWKVSVCAWPLRNRCLPRSLSGARQRPLCCWCAGDAP